MIAEAFDRYGIECELLHDAGASSDDGEEADGGNTLGAIPEEDTDQDDRADTGNTDDSEADNAESAEKPVSEQEVHVVGFENLKPLKKAAGHPAKQQVQQAGNKNSDNKNSDNKKGQKDSYVEKPAVDQHSGDMAKKPAKKLSKRAAKKYADQDDEDRELAMLALGHKKKPSSAEQCEGTIAGDTKGKKAGGRNNASEVSNRLTELSVLACEQANSPCFVFCDSYRELLSGLPAQAQTSLLELIEAKNFAVGDIDEFEVKSLQALEEEDCLAVVDLFVQVSYVT
jgi:hypothetical protein